MAIDATEKIQGFGQLKPSTFTANMQAYLGDVRRHYQARVSAAQAAHAIIAPFNGVIESVRATQTVVGGGAGQNSVTLAVAGVDCFDAVGDGNTFLGNVAAGTSALTYPTDNLVEQADHVERVEFTKGNLILLTAVGANHGVVLYEMVLARKVPQDF